MIDFRSALDLDRLGRAADGFLGPLGLEEGGPQLDPERGVDHLEEVGGDLAGGELQVLAGVLGEVDDFVFAIDDERRRPVLLEQFQVQLAEEDLAPALTGPRRGRGFFFRRAKFHRGERRQRPRRRAPRDKRAPPPGRETGRSGFSNSGAAPIDARKADCAGRPSRKGCWPRYHFPLRQ